VAAEKRLIPAPGLIALDQSFHPFQGRFPQQIGDFGDRLLRHVVGHTPDAVRLIEHGDLAHFAHERSEICAVAGGQPCRHQDIDLAVAHPPKHLLVRRRGALDPMAAGDEDPLDFACRGVVEAQADVPDADGTCHVCPRRCFGHGLLTTPRR